MLTIKSSTLLTENGLSLLDHEVKCNGTDFVKKATDIDLSEKEQLTLEEVNRLKDFQAGLSVGKMSPRAEDYSYNQKTMKEIANKTTIAIFGLFIAIILVSLSPHYNKDSKDIIFVILGVLSTIAAQIYSYYFGSSVGSGEARSVMVKNLSNGDEADKKSTKE